MPAAAQLGLLPGVGAAVTKRDRVIHELARVLYGLQVPLSIAPARVMLGEAIEPLLRLREKDMLGLFGYPSVTEIEARLIEELAEPQRLHDGSSSWERGETS